VRLVAWLGGGLVKRALSWLLVGVDVDLDSGDVG